MKDGFDRMIDRELFKDILLRIMTIVVATCSVLILVRITFDVVTGGLSHVNHCNHPHHKEVKNAGS